MVFFGMPYIQFTVSKEDHDRIKRVADLNRRSIKAQAWVMALEKLAEIETKESEEASKP